jgi:hypothetical protein
MALNTPLSKYRVFWISDFLILIQFVKLNSIHYSMSSVEIPYAILMTFHSWPKICDYDFQVILIYFY